MEAILLSVRIPFDVVIELLTEDGPDITITEAKAEIVRCCIKDMTIQDMRTLILKYYGMDNVAMLKKENPTVMNIFQQYFGVILWGE